MFCNWFYIKVTQKQVEMYRTVLIFQISFGFQRNCRSKNFWVETTTWITPDLPLGSTRIHRMERPVFTRIHQGPSCGSIRIHHVDPPASSMWIHQDPSHGSTQLPQCWELIKDLCWSSHLIIFLSQVNFLFLPTFLFKSCDGIQSVWITEPGLG